MNETLEAARFSWLSFFCFFKYVFFFFFKLAFLFGAFYLFLFFWVLLKQYHVCMLASPKTRVFWAEVNSQRADTLDCLRRAQNEVPLRCWRGSHEQFRRGGEVGQRDATLGDHRWLGRFFPFTNRVFMFLGYPVFLTHSHISIASVIAMSVVYYIVATTLQRNTRDFKHCKKKVKSRWLPRSSTETFNPSYFFHTFFCQRNLRSLLFF